MIEEDRILQAMPNIVMALHVLCEKMSNDSFWKPYLSIHDKNLAINFFLG